MLTCLYSPIDMPSICSYIAYKQQGSFLDYFKQLTENRKRSQGNYGNWQSTYQILLKFTDGKGLTFEEVTPEFLEKFKKYLLEMLRPMSMSMTDLPTLHIKMQSS